MSDELENGVLQILPLFKTYFLEIAGKITSSKVVDVEFVETNTTSNRGRGGTLLISDVTFNVILDEDTLFPLTRKIAIKFAQDLKSAIKEMKNSMLLESKYSSHPRFGTPKILYGNTHDPIILLYEGIDGVNYDVCNTVPNKSFYAGKLLSILHSSNLQPVDDLLYQNYVRKIVQYFAATGMEREISISMGQEFNRIKGVSSGAVIHSDFHQSNVMLTTGYDGSVHKVYVIDPEFMTTGHYDRMEDVGTFFGNQALIEFNKSKNILNTIRDIKIFLMGYNENLANSPQKLNLNTIYPNGIPLAFFISLWALLDALDYVMTRTEGNSLDHPEVIIRINFGLFCLRSKELAELSETKF